MKSAHPTQPLQFADRWNERRSIMPAKTGQELDLVRITP
jgi:hypothetical protein